ncbi:MAG: flavin reductase family protein [Acidobacteriia bacterium]|nr:flavin reductase family protein [Terriglobia bacterium]
MNLEDTKKAIYSLTYGVYVITTKRGEEVSAMTAVWVAQVSKEPMQVVVGLTPESCTTRMMLESRIFAINVLAREQQELAYALGRATSSETDKLIGIPTRTAVTGSPILCDSIAYLDCRVISHKKVGSHFVIMGEVVEGSVLNDYVPAVYRNGKIF